MKIEIPKIKKTISSFLSGEEGKISGKAAVGLGVAIAAIATQITPVLADACCSCTCGSGGGCCSCGAASGCTACSSCSCGGYGAACGFSSGGTTYTSSTTIEYSNGQIIGKHTLT